MLFYKPETYLLPQRPLPQIEAPTPLFQFSPQKKPTVF